MKTVSKKARVVSLAIVLGALGGALSFWLFQGDDARKFNHLKENSLCALDLPAGVPSASATFTLTQPIEKFYVGVKTSGSSEPMSLSISGDKGVVGSVSFKKTGPFALGREIHPGNYTITLSQGIEGKGGSAVISDEEPIYTTGSQIWSRTYFGLLVFSGICVLLSRKSMDMKKRALSFTAFHTLLLGFALLFVYLLFHEGGHALAQIFFGTFDLARSDFWGIHGHPHSGGTMASLKPWQHTVISCAGPMLPTFAGFALFVLWSLPMGRKFRSAGPMVNLYFSAIVAVLVFAETVVGPASLLGFITAEGNLTGYVTNAGGPVWLVTGLLWGSSLICVIILWRVLPEIQRAWKAQFLEPWKPVYDLPTP